MSMARKAEFFFQFSSCPRKVFEYFLHLQHIMPILQLTTYKIFLSVTYNPNLGQLTAYKIVCHPPLCCVLVIHFPCT